MFDPHAVDPEAQLQAAVQQCTAWRDLKHQGLVALLDHFSHEAGSFATVWEQLDYDPLDSYLLRNGPLPEKEARGIVMQLLSALRAVVSKDIVLTPQDLRPPSLLVRGGDVKIVGVGFLSQVRRPAEPSRGGRTIMRSASGLTDAQPEPRRHPALVSPYDEVAMLGEDWTAGAVRAVGATLHEMLFGRAPAQSEPGATVQLPDCHRLSTECREFLLRLLDREQRLSLQTVSQDAFVAPPIRGRQR